MTFFLIGGIFWLCILYYSILFPPLFLLMPIFLAFFHPNVERGLWVVFGMFLGLAPDQFFGTFPYYSLLFGISGILMLPWVEWVNFAHPLVPFFFGGLGAGIWTLADEGMKWIYHTRFVPMDWRERGMLILYFLLAGWAFWTYGQLGRKKK